MKDADNQIICNSDDEKNVNILVVDDQINTVMLIKKYFDTLKFSITTAYNGQEALEFFKNDRNPFDLVILDIMMPYMNGYEVCKVLRKSYSLYELPILFLTAKSSMRDLMVGFDLGANDYLTKPFDSKELLARSKNLVKLKRLTEANTILKQAIDLKTSLHQMTIHDLKNPLSAIRTLSNLILDDIDANDSNVQYLKMIVETSDNMFELVNNFLEMDKLESGKLALNKEFIDMNLITNAVVGANIENARAKEQNVFFTPLNSEYRYVFADATKIREVIDNLISNAIKYSSLKSDIVVSLQNYTDNSLKIRFSVSDSGPGLTEKDKQKLFQKFSKLSAKPTGGEKSSGLGLAIAKMIIDLHEGKIWAENGKKCGAVFSFELEALDKSECENID